MDKLKWIADKLGIGGASAEEKAAAEEAERLKVQREVDGQQSAWKAERQGWVMGGSGLDSKYSSGL